MTKKKTALCAAAAAVILISGAAFVNRDRLREYRENRQIIRIAQDYLQQKYGFKGKPQKTSRLADYSNVLFTDEKGYRIYRVYLDPNRQPVLDTYQYDEIVSALKTRIMEDYPDCHEVLLSLSCPEQYIEQLGATARYTFGLDADTKFDGSNLDAILTNCEIELMAYFSETDLEKAPLTDLLETHCIDGRFVAFDTQAHLMECRRAGWSSRSASVPDDVLYAPYITQIREFGSKSQSSALTNYPLHEGEGFLYCCPAFPQVQCMESEQQPEDAVTKSFWLDSGDHAAYIYYPIESLPDSESLYVKYGANAGESTSKDSLIPCGDYAVAPLIGEMNPRWYLAKYAEP